MIAALKRLGARVLAWLVTLIWKKEGSAMLSGTIEIGGTAVPLAALGTVAATVVPKLVADLQAGKDAQTILADLEAEAGPAALASAELIANILYPGAGTVIEIVAFLVEHRTKTWSQADENRWMDRFTANIANAGD